MAEVLMTDVEKVYADGTRAVTELNLRIDDGHLLVIVGPSGCGKTTALRMVAGLEEISSGTIHIGGREVNRLDPGERDVAMVFQNYALYPHMTVYGNIAFPLRLARMPKAERDTKVRADGEGAGAGEPPPAQAAPAVGRPAPARGDGPRDRPRAERVPDGRAALQPGREAARADARRDLDDPAPVRRDHAVRHP